MMKKKQDSNTLKWIYEVAGSGKKWTALLLVIRILQGSTGVLYALFLADVIDGAASGSKELFIRKFLIFCLLILAHLTLRALAKFIEEKASTTLEKNFRIRFFRQLLGRDYGQVSAVHTGDWMNRITSDTTIVVNAIVQILPGLSYTVVQLVAAVVALMVIMPLVVTILLPASLLMAVVSLFLRKKLKNDHKLIQKADGVARSFFQERLASLLVVHSFTQERSAVATGTELMENLSKARMRRIRLVTLCHTVLYGAMNFAQILGVGLCGWQILIGNMTFGTMSAVLQLVGQMEAPFTSISGFLPQYYAMLASAERLMLPESYEPDVRGMAVPEEDARRYYAEEFQAMGLEKVSFAYADAPDQPVLKDRSLRIEKGQFVAFTGESGCGKSTTMKLLLGLYTPSGGKLYLQNAKGEEKTLDATWRSLFAYVPQGNQLVSGTIREALTFGNAAMMEREDAIWQALTVACAEDFVRQQPESLDTVLGERGSGLSEGQLQRLAIARAVLSERPVLLLDEATSALDGPTEKQVLQNLRTMTDRTVMLITHREAALDVCNRQVHFEKS